MITYEAVIEKASEKLFNEEITYEQFLEVDDLAFGKYVEEGANIDNLKTFFSARKDLKEINKKIREAKKEGNKLKIKKYAHDGAKTCDDCIKELKKVDDTVMEAIIGLFIRWIPSFNRDFAITAALSAPVVAPVLISNDNDGTLTAGAAAGYHARNVRLVEDMAGMIATIKEIYKNRDDLHTKDFNMARNKCIQMMEGYKKAYEKLAK